ncbi:hypothetical protein IU443_12480 [Nocardia farcinica]|uniref:DUF4286 family protein n=1 Tax=Nocardia farcinica TaxID=37329 RepID=UPI000A3C45C8|nr:DUF4286 family protein [Nocardia farcinica]MBA4857475.1 hypothetical protein [Nocardia farcinica]MBC9816226.1 hypothetical protein [Nocardia farcinica]MBF6072457.1 hypothetical protein [Nocardia farcinica]MBF6262371.1 hypothetical protein [Nocardia farcinica]MBF6280911.1 hypothetical protein [Nocardia farcinica]
MPRHILLVHSAPADSRDDEYNTWYDEVHLPDVLEVDGFVAARRFVAAASIHGERPELPYLAIYEIETDDLPAALAALSAAAKKMVIHPAFDRSSQQTFAFTELPVSQN